MTRLILFLLVLSTAGAHAALTLVAREPFVGPGTLTSASPGSNFSSVTGTLTMVRVGPRTSAIAAPGWSADVRTSGPSNFRGTINLSGAASTCGMWGAWVRIKALPTSGDYLSVLQLVNLTNNVVMDFSLNPQGVIVEQPYVNGAANGGAPPTFTSPAIPLNTWVWLAVAWKMETGQNYGIRCMEMPLGGTTPTIWGSADNMNSAAFAFTAVNVGLQTGGNGPMLRVGCPSLYAMSSFSDIAYPSDVIAPVEKSYNWYVNAASGNDANDGATPSTAWKTAAKITAESQYCGMLDSNVTGPGGGDVLTIDTSGGTLPIGPNVLTFNTRGLTVQPASGQTYIKFQAEEFLANASFTLASGLSHTYKTSDTQTNIVAWENDLWMWHVQAASFASSAIVTDPKTGVATNYASAGAALDATPGSFYTDGATLYIHPFNNTNPVSDGNVYTRSYNRSTNSAIVFNVGGYLANGFYVRKTALVDSGNNDFLAYCFQDEAITSNGLNSEVENGYFAYGDKHCFGTTGCAPASSLLVLNTECEQGHPYCGYGGQSPFVSYTGTATADIVHTYRGCTCLARSGLIGSAAGDPVGTGGDIILSHNNGTGISFASITIDDCNFGSGNIDINAANNLVITDGTSANGVATSCPNTTIQETTFTGQVVQMSSPASALTIKNSLIKPVVALSNTHPVYYGLLVFGNVTVEGCTLDLAGLTGDSSSYFQQAFLQRIGALNLTFRNNAYIVPTGENFPLLYNITGSDVLTFDHNAYNLGSGTTLARQYNGASTGSLTFAQWQALGQDCSNSTLNANLLLQNDAPQSGSPLFNAGLDLGAGPDVTGTTYAHRDTIGAYEGSASYRAPQSLTNFPPLGSGAPGTSVNLPATTSAGLAVIYSVLSGPAQIVGTRLTFTGTGTVTLMATQAGNGSNAPLSEIETLAVSVASSTVDTPTLPPAALALLGVLLAFAATRQLRAA
jgi:hypothetical protein